MAAAAAARRGGLARLEQLFLASFSALHSPLSIRSHLRLLFKIGHSPQTNPFRVPFKARITEKVPLLFYAHIVSNIFEDRDKQLVDNYAGIALDIN